jgi:acyl-CoA dehydrogenase
MTVTLEAVDPELLATVDAFFTRSCGHDVVAHAERHGMPFELWSGVSALGLHLVAIAEDRGGSGGHLSDLLAVLRLAARHAAPLPLAENHLAAWLLTESGSRLPDGCLTIAPGTASDHLSINGGRATGVLHDVPWAQGATRVIALTRAAGANEKYEVVSLDPASCEQHVGSDLAGQPLNRVTFVDVPVESAVSPHGPESLLLRGALLRAAQIAGAVEAASDLTQRFTAQREQFGRPVATFQAVQQHLVTLAQAAAMTTLTVERAGFAAEQGAASFEICAAKLIANENAGLAVSAAHQAHGAIGMTREYRLQQFTRRLNTWRSEFGTSQALQHRLGTAAGSASSFAHLVTDDNTLEH